MPSRLFWAVEYDLIGRRDVVAVNQVLGNKPDCRAARLFLGGEVAEANSVDAVVFAEIEGFDTLGLKFCRKAFSILDIRECSHLDSITQTSDFG